MKSIVQLSEMQRHILDRFYKKRPRKIFLVKKERDKIWDDFVSHRDIANISHLEREIPALFSEMRKALKNEKNIQTAVFSECVYAQDLALVLDLENFTNYQELKRIKLQINNEDRIKSSEMTARYSFTKSDNSSILYQAGGAGMVDCALVDKTLEYPIMIEMKEPYARTSEPDLPKYGENGLLVNSDAFKKGYPQFQSMLEEQIDKELNVFDHIGSNVGEFSQSSIVKAVTENYSGEKFAHVICTEDSNGILIMLPANHVTMWAKLEGEIRPSGRNSYKVWTPIMLENILINLGARINGDDVLISEDKLIATNARGSREISRYKINPLFFLRAGDVKFKSGFAYFSLNSVRQLNPSITAKMKFENLSFDKVKNFYLELL